MTSPMKPGPMRKTEGDILDSCYAGKLEAIDVVFILPRSFVHMRLMHSEMDMVT